jgi:S1-C subfamily serine protease
MLRKALTVLLAGGLLAGCGGSDTPRASAPQLQGQFVKTVRDIGPEVVQIETPRGLGSGIVLDGKGDIVTNNHVVGSATRFRVTFADGSREAAKLVGAFAPDDLAVIRAAAPHGSPAHFADSDKLEVGDIVLAVGNPLGLRSSVTNGIVSALGRTVSEPGGTAIPGMIQTSAAINPGNSGGALVDLDGDVVGIPTLAAVDQELGGSAPGIGFAIAGNMVKDIAGQIVDHGHVVDSHRAFLGVRAASATGGQGAVVVAVEKGGPAEQAGIRPGDLITAVGGQTVHGAAGLDAALASLQPGKTVKVKVVHSNGAHATVDAKLGQYPTGG